MKDYKCNSCGFEFDQPKQIGENESEVFVCPNPECKSEDFEPNRPETKPTNF